MRFLIHAIILFIFAFLGQVVYGDIPVVNWSLGFMGGLVCMVIDQ